MEVQETYGDQVAIIGVPGLEDNTAIMQRFIDDTGTHAIDHIPDPEGALWERFGVKEQRTYVYIDDDGSSRIVGYGSLAEDVQAMIATTSP